MRSFSTTITAPGMARPLASTTRPVRMAFVAAVAGDAAQMAARAAAAIEAFSSVLIQGSRVIELFGDCVGQMVRRLDAGERAEAQYPALQRAIDADIQRHRQRAGMLVSPPLLRRVPFARGDVVGDRRLEFDFDVLRRSRV